MKPRPFFAKMPSIVRQGYLPVLLISLLILSPGVAMADRQVTLAWEANQEETLMGYRVFCRQASQVYDYSRPLWDGTETTCTLIGLDDYSDYAFVVRAYDTNGHESADSQEVWLLGQTATPTQPAVIAPANDATDVFLTPVLQTAPFRSLDPNDRHLQTQWMLTRTSDDICVLDVTSDSHLTELDIPPLVLEENTVYHWTARYISSKGGVSPWSASNAFTTGISALDGNGDGTPDDQEVGMTVDLDANGIADIDQDDLRCVNVLDGLGQMAVCAPDGSGVARIAALEATDLTTVGSMDRSPFDLPLGLISFRLEMDYPGGIARVRVHFSEPAPDAAIWVKYDIINGWQDYSAHTVFAHDRMSADIELQDGGFGDADGVANGIIIDPAGYGVATGNAPSGDDGRLLDSASSPSASSGGGGGGCFISTLH
jgi:hypothetical protein